MSKIAFLYPGQGAQCIGMGADFYEKSEAARDLYDQAGKAIDLDVAKLCFEENAKLDLTEYTQAAMVTTCLAMTRVLRQAGIEPQGTAGLSLGEYAAIAAAGGMEELDAIRLVRTRGILMQNTVPVGEGTMSAVLGMDAEAIEKVLASIDGVTIANYNCPGQIVITGKSEAVEEAGRQLKEAGAKRVLPLSVSGPFHSPMLAEAGEHLREELEKITFRKLEVPYVTNVTAELVDDIAETKELLSAQVSASVRWMQSMQTMLDAGYDTFIEIGPGKTLTGFLRKINRGIKAYNISKWEDVERVKEELAAQS